MRLLPSRPALGDHPGAPDAHLVQEDERHHHEQHRDGVGRREQRRGEGGDHEGVAPVARQELGRDQSQGREDHHDEGQLGHEPERDHNLRGESEVVVRRDDGGEVVALEAEQHGERARQHPLVRHARAQQKQHHAHRQGRDDQAPLAIVERGREERPCLVDDHRRRHQQPQREGELERDEERLGRAREHEPSAGHERRDRGLEEPDHVYPLDDEPADQRAHDDGEQAVQDAPAQLLEVVEERHLAAQGWVRHGAPGARRGARDAQRPRRCSLSRARLASSERGYPATTLA